MIVCSCNVLSDQDVRSAVEDKAGQDRGKTMVMTYREVAIKQMIVTVEEAMSQVLDYWGDLPPSMKEAVEQFRTRLGAAIDSVEFVKRALDRQVHETGHGKGPP